MPTNVKVEKKANENSTSLVRRFTKKVQKSGILPRVKSIRFSDRKVSEFKKKQDTLKKLRKQKERERLIKLGKIPESTYYKR